MDLARTGASCVEICYSTLFLLGRGDERGDKYTAQEGGGGGQ